MATIYLLNPDGSNSPRDEAEVAELTQRGLLAADSLYWKEGMAEWRPLRELAGASTLPSLTVPAPGSVGYIFTKDPSKLTQWAEGLMYAMFAFAILSTLISLGRVGCMISDNYSETVESSIDLIEGLVALADLVLYITTAIIFLKWIYRANLNCRGFGAQGMQYTPGWCIGWYFIPFLNLVRPYYAMREIWQVSTNPREWTLQPVSALVQWWWAAWLASNILGTLSGRLSLHATTLEQKSMAAWVTLSSDAVDIPLCLLAVALIAAIYRKQSLLVGRATA